MTSWELTLLSFLASWIRPVVSMFVLDIPMLTRTILPEVDRLPVEFRGVIWLARVRPSLWWVCGSRLVPFGYSPPLYPRYVPLPRSFRGTRPGTDVPLQFEPLTEIV